MDIKLRTTKGCHWSYIHDQLFDCFPYSKGKPYLIAVYACLCRHSDAQQRTFPSQKTIAQETGMSERKVRGVIRDLGLRHVLIVERKRVHSHKTRNEYLLTHPNEWIMRDPQGASDVRYQVPPKKTQKKNTNNSINEIRSEIRDLVVKKRMFQSTYPP